MTALVSRYVELQGSSVRNMLLTRSEPHEKRGAKCDWDWMTGRGSLASGVSKSVLACVRAKCDVIDHATNDFF